MAIVVQRSTPVALTSGNGEATQSPRYRVITARRGAVLGHSAERAFSPGIS